MSCDKPNGGCYTPGCSAPDCVPADCMLELGECILDNSGVPKYTAVYCPSEYRARYAAGGLVELKDNGGEFISMARVNKGTTCGINFVLPFRNNSGRTVAYLPHPSDCLPTREQPTKCPESAITQAAALVSSLSRCADVMLPTGTYTNATVTVGATGCIVGVQAGTPPLYTPDECCGGGSGSTNTGGGVAGPRGLPGTAATITIESEVIQGLGSQWSVTNIGTPNAAVLRFTAPVPTTAGNANTTGATGTINGFKVEAGLVKTMPKGLVTNIIGTKQGAYTPSLYTLNIIPTPLDVEGTEEIQLNLDPLYSALKDMIDALKTRIADLETLTAQQANKITTLEGWKTTAEGQITTLQGQYLALFNGQNNITNDLSALTNRYNTHTTHPVP